MITYHSDLSRIGATDLQGFFTGWPNPPSPQAHHRLLAGSSQFIVATRAGESRVIGYIAAISDGVLSAYISQLEVLPEHRGRGIGTKLLRSMLERLRDLYMVDLVCDRELQPFYEAAGMTRWSAMIVRNYDALMDSRASR